LHLLIDDRCMPKILVPLTKRVSLVRATHVKMFHLGSDKVASALKKQYYWPKMAFDVRKILTNALIVS
jgi:hypothetical protein